MATRVSGNGRAGEQAGDHKTRTDGLNYWGDHRDLFFPVNRET